MPQKQERVVVFDFDKTVMNSPAFNRIYFQKIVERLKQNYPSRAEDFKTIDFKWTSAYQVLREIYKLNEQEIQSILWTINVESIGIQASDITYAYTKQLLEIINADEQCYIVSDNLSPAIIAMCKLVWVQMRPWKILASDTFLWSKVAKAQEIIETLENPSQIRLLWDSETDIELHDALSWYAHVDLHKVEKDWYQNIDPIALKEYLLCLKKWNMGQVKKVPWVTHYSYQAV